MCHLKTRYQTPMLTSSPIHQSAVYKNSFLTKLKKYFANPYVILWEIGFDFLKMHQKTPLNTQSQRSLTSIDYNIPAEAGIIIITLFSRFPNFNIIS